MKRLITPIPGVGAQRAAPLNDLAVYAVIALLFVLLLAALPIVAQEATQPVTFDQVNKIAKILYCPVCPGETLDVCQTQACAQWREEIRQQLADGQSEKEIIDSFVRRYGDRVLGSPQDPTLRLLSLIAPILAVIVALGVGVFTFTRWRGRTASPTTTSPPSPASDDYRNQLERDLQD